MINKKDNKAKLIYLIIISLFVFLILFVFTSKIKAENDNEIYFDPSNKNLRMGEELKVDIILSTKEKILGADVKINFDPAILEVKGIDNGKAFKLMPLKMSKEGTISITGLSESKDAFSGKATFATLKLRAKDAGDTRLRIAFEKGSTTDSNLTKEKATDVLTKVGEGHYIIGTSVQRTGAGLKKSALKILLFLIFLLFVGALIFLYYRWRKYKKETEEIYVPTIPMDRPPTESP